MALIHKNDIVEMEITGMTAQGAGVGHWEGFAVFTPLTAPGDKARICLWPAGRTPFPLPGPDRTGLPLFCTVRRMLLPAYLLRFGIKDQRGAGP